MISHCLGFVCFTYSSAQTQVVAQSQHTPWSQIVGTLGAWYGFTPVFVVWSVCQVEALPHPSVLIVDVCWRLLFVCLLLISLGGCIHALKCCLQPGQSQVSTASWTCLCFYFCDIYSLTFSQFQGEPPGTEQEIVTEIRNDQCLRWGFIIVTLISHKLAFSWYECFFFFLATVF